MAGVFAGTEDISGRTRFESPCLRRESHTPGTRLGARLRPGRASPAARAAGEKDK